MIENFKSQRIGQYATFLVQIEECWTCKNNMVKEPSGQHPFPLHYRFSFDQQRRRAAFTYRSNIKVDNEYICIECEEAGKATFKCALCKERHDSDEKHTSIGDWPEFLCIPCYETVPARVWEDKIEELEEEHRYDFG